MTSNRVFVDTNVLVYALDPTDPAKRRRAGDVLRRGMASSDMVVSPQTLNECYRVLVYKRALVGPEEARAYVTSFFFLCDAPLDVGVTTLALDLAPRTRGSWWDCVMIASALRFGCRSFVTEDRQSRGTIEGMPILDVFGTPLERIFPPH